MGQPKGTVLVVDDYSDGRALLTYVLTAAGHDVVVAANGAETLARVDDAPDLIILDVHLPDMDGFEVCRRLKADTRSALIPVVMVSAVFSRTEHRVRGLTDGADAYLPKPFEPELLIATVEALLRQRASERALAYRNRLLRLEYELARMLSEPPCVAGDPTGVLDALAEALDADVAEFWRAEPGDGVLVRSGVWHRPGIDGAPLDRSADGVRVSCGIDGVGTLSAAGTAEWREALSTRLSTSRTAAAEAAGLRSATVIPVLARGIIAGALVLFHRRARQPDQDTRQLVADVRDFLWALLERPGAAHVLGLTKDVPEVTAAMDANRLAGGVAHELKNLLFVIGVRTELLMEAMPAEVSRRRDLDTILGATKRAAALLQGACD
jgi:CheY-like chemotaxis protein